MARSVTAQAAECTQLDLRGRRVKKGLSLEQIAESTKISIRFLRAIEAEDFEKLPGGIFNISYLKQYAGAIGFDPSKLLSFYERQVEPESEETLMQAPRGLFRWLRVSATAGR